MCPVQCSMHWFISTNSCGESQNSVLASLYRLIWFTLWIRPDAAARTLGQLHRDNISHSQDTGQLSVSLNIEAHKYSWNSQHTAHIDLTMSAGSSSSSSSSRQSSQHRVLNAKLLAAQTNDYFIHPRTLIFVMTGDNYLTLQAIQYQQGFRNVMCSLWSLFYCCLVPSCLLISKF